jgi:tetratricopeptide (TPR) repeat protein
MENEAAEKVAQRFLNTGSLQNTKFDELAAACDRIVQKDARTSLKTALRTARRFAARAKPHGGALELMAQRSLARVTHQSGAHAEALKAYRKARALARLDPIVCARIDRALVDVYMYLGRFRDSELAARRSIATFRRLGSAVDLAQTRVNYGNLLHRQDRHREAERIYRAAVEYFETTDNSVALARCCYNLANSLVQLFQMEEAEHLYEKACKLWDEAGFELDACDARYGLAWLYMLTGRLHTALLDLRACQLEYHKAGHPRGEALCVIDRAEVSLHLGLSADALESARDAEIRFAKLGLRYETSKAALFRAQSALALGRRAEARHSVQKALKGFSRDKNNGFLGVALLTEVDIMADGGAPVSQLLVKARKHFHRIQLPLWQAVSDLKEAVASSQPHLALKRLASNRAAHHVPHLYALWQVLQGDAEYQSGRPERARSCWQSAADRLDAVRAQLPPVELRSTYGRHQNSPHARLVDFELTRDPLLAAVWSERQKTAGVWRPPMLDSGCHSERLQVEATLEALAGQFNALAHQVNASGSERGRPAQADTRIVSRFQRQIREQLIRIESSSAAAQDSTDWLRTEIVQLSRHRPMVQFHLTDSDIVAFIHFDKHTVAVSFPGGRGRLISALQRWHFVLEAELLPGYPGQSERLQVEEALWEEIADWLWRPLGIDPDAPTIVIIPEGELANLPWEALRLDNTTLGARHRFVLSPSIRHYASARARHTDSQEIEVFRGAGNDLPHVDSELQALKQLAGGRAHLHAPTMRGDWPSEGDSSVWHFSGHSTMNEENPFYSNLVLGDGPIFAVDFRVKQCQVNLATLAACRSGEQVALPGEESTGIVRSLLEMGARNVIAGRWPVSDQTAAIWMQTFYQRFFAGSDILDASRDAALKVKETYPSAFHWAAFAVFGAGDIGGMSEKK